MERMYEQNRIITTEEKWKRNRSNSKSWICCFFFFCFFSGLLLLLLLLVLLLLFGGRKWIRRVLDDDDYNDDVDDDDDKLYPSHNFYFIFTRRILILHLNRFFVIFCWRILFSCFLLTYDFFCPVPRIHWYEQMICLLSDRVVKEDAWESKWLWMNNKKGTRTR